VSDRESPRFTRVNGPLMARLLDHVEGRPSAFQAGHIPSWRGSCERYALSLVAAACRWLLLLLSPAGLLHLPPACRPPISPARPISLGIGQIAAGNTADQATRGPGVAVVTARHPG